MKVEDLRERIEKLPPLPPEGERTSWQSKQADIRRHFSNDNPEDFIRWSSIEATMFVGDCDHVRDELGLMQSNGWDRWQRAMVADGFGARESELYPGTSGNIIHQAYHLAIWEKATGKKVEDLGHIVEIGGGYGSMVKVARALGFRGLYLIFDLPELSALQEYYLSAHQGWNYFESDLDYFLKVGEFTDLLIGIYSLSEMPFDLRDRILDGVRTKSYLFAFQSTFDGMDNKGYFMDFSARKEEFGWKGRRVVRFPGSRYLIGERK